MSQEIRFIDPDKLLEANRDYIDRIERQGLDAVYDSTLDSLFIEIGGPTESLSEHLAALLDLCKLNAFLKCS